MLFAYYITYNLYCATKWPFPRRRKLDFGLEFARNGFEEHFIFTEGSSKPIRDDQVIRVAGDGYLSNSTLRATINYADNNNKIDRSR